MASARGVESVFFFVLVFLSLVFDHHRPQEWDWRCADAIVCDVSEASRWVR